MSRFELQFENQNENISKPLVQKIIDKEMSLNLNDI